MFFEIIKAILYGIVEGITEWLPVSSTGHLILLEQWFPLNASEGFMEMFDVVIQLGAILAVIVLFFHKLNPFAPTKDKKQKAQTWDLWFKVVAAVIPSAVLGFLLDDWMDEHLYNHYVVAIMLIVYGVAFLWVEKYNQNPQKISVVHNGLDNVFEAKGTTPKVYPKLVTFLGRITHQKGPEYFVEAAAKVLKKDSDVHFVVAGSGDMLHSLIERVARMGLSSRFHFTGFLKGAVVQRLLKISDVYVMPSVSEPFGISALEAAGCHVPLVISRQSGVSEVVDNALKVDYWDTDAMANSIYALLNYSGLKKSILKGSSDELRLLTWKAACQKLKNLYSQLIIDEK